MRCAALVHGVLTTRSPAYQLEAFLTIPEDRTSADRTKDGQPVSNICVIGGANVDIHGKPTAKLVPRDSNPGSVQVSPGGVARNMAENLARLGNRCHLISAVGKDDHGDMLVNACGAAGVDTRHMFYSASANTSTYLSILDQEGDLVAAINDMTVIDQLTPAVLAERAHVVEKASVVLIDTNLSEDTLRYIADICTDQTIFVDTVSTPKAARIRPCLGSIHTLKPSLAEAESLSGIDTSGGDQMADLAKWFHDRGVARLVVSLGSAGVYCSDGTGGFHEPALDLKRSRVFANGAGDALMAGLVHGWQRGWAFVTSVRFAIYAATIAATREETIAPDMSSEAVHKLMKEQYADPQYR